MMRYALYYAPRPDSALWSAGCRWLGRDAASGGLPPRPEVDGVGAVEFAALTGAAARYGWHATLKAPFAPGPDVGEDALLRRTAELAAGFEPFALPLRVDWLDRFLALRPAAPPPELAELAAACTVALAPLADRGEPIKARDGLDARQRALYRRWGYPYVFEQFRFHLTLSADVERDSATARALELGARRHFDGLLDDVVVDGIALFVEPEAGGPFRCLAYCGFDGKVRRHGD
ncbi:DUF1045 domain-containing protein [Chromobacterium vaccinii]|uniref:DUF1045 domain-containing protein n=1 Tax=Chromobacterium vaccinii TaxID=1108595 RepID=UPI003C7214B3